MELLGFTAAISIGLILGLIGAGGSILTVPVMVYLFHIDPYLATTYSLFIVGSTSLAGIIPYSLKKQVDYKTALAFGIPSILGVFLARTWIHPHIPEHFFDIAGYAVSKDMALMLLFAVLMVFAAGNMIWKKEATEEQEEQPSKSSYLLAVQGILVGLIVGLVGAGGGFLIIPALIIFNKMELKTAIGSSLFIIALNSLFGFASSNNIQEIHWWFMLAVTGIALVGMLLGSWLSQKIAAQKLKPFFGYFVLAMAFWIIFQELSK